jgi:hypothetical protein
MRRRKAFAPILAGLAAAALLAACGGGGGQADQGSTTTPAEPATVLTWEPPATTVDNITLDPYMDLDYYEVYVRTDENFSDADLPVAQVAAVQGILSPDGQSVTKALISEFELENLPYLPAAPHLFVSVKAVGVDRQKSQFMAPVEWDRS